MSSNSSSSSWIACVATDFVFFVCAVFFNREKYMEKNNSNGDVLSIHSDDDVPVLASTNAGVTGLAHNHHHHHHHHGVETGVEHPQQSSSKMKDEGAAHSTPNLKAKMSTVSGTTTTTTTSTTKPAAALVVVASPTSALVVPPPPLSEKNMKRFMNPIAERDANTEREHRLQDHRRVVVPRSPVPMHLSGSTAEEIRAMGLMLHTLYHGGMAPQISAIRSNNKAIEIMKETELQWSLVASSLSLDQIRSSSSSKLHHHGSIMSEGKSDHNNNNNATSSSSVLNNTTSTASLSNSKKRGSSVVVVPPLPIVVKMMRQLSNDDARLLFRSGGTRSGVFGVFRWHFDEEDEAGQLKPVIPHQDMVKDPFVDYILSEDAEEHRQEDGGMMIPVVLQHLVEEGQPEDDDCGDGFDDIGEHCLYGRRNLLALSQLRLWQHHHQKLSPPSQINHHHHRSNKSPAKGHRDNTNDTYSHRSLHVSIDSPRSTFVLVKNGQKASDLAVSVDPLLEERRQRQIMHLQHEYRNLCKQISQRDMVRLLAQSSQSSTPLAETEQTAVVPTHRALTPLTVRDDAKNNAPNASLLSECHGRVIEELGSKVKRSAAAKMGAISRQIEQHRALLASVWGKELHMMTLDMEKELRVRIEVERVKEEKRLRAAGLLTSVRASSSSSASLSKAIAAAQSVHDSESAEDGADESLSDSGSPASRRSHQSPANQSTSDRPTTPTSMAPSLAAKNHLHPSATPSQQQQPRGLVDRTPPIGNKKQTPIEFVREQYKLKEAARIRELEAALEAKDRSAKACQQRKREKLEIMRRQQLAVMHEVSQKCERVKRTAEFQNSLMLLHQDQERQMLDHFDAQRSNLRKTLKDIQHEAHVHEQQARETFVQTQTSLRKTLFYEEQRRRAATSMGLTSTVAKDQHRLPSALLERGSANVSVSSTAMVPMKSPSRSPSPSTLAGGPHQHRGLGDVDIHDLLPKSHRRKWDPVATQNSKVRLVSLLAKEAEMQAALHTSTTLRRSM